MRSHSHLIFVTTITTAGCVKSVKFSNGHVNETALILAHNVHFYNKKKCYNNTLSLRQLCNFKHSVEFYSVSFYTHSASFYTSSVYFTECNFTHIK